MHITRLVISNYQRVVRAEIPLRAPILFLAGPNEAGKTSIADAVYHAINSEARRVKLKKDFADLVHDGQKRGAVIIETTGAEGDGAISLTIPAEKRTVQGIDIHPLMPILLDAKRFPALPADQRRSILFGLSKTKITGKAILEKLREKGADPKKTTDIGAVLLAGFEASCAEAKSKASEARGSWKTVTGEAYGSKKAPDWKAEKPEFDAELIDRLEADQTKADDEVHDLTIQQGTLQEQRRSFAAQELRRVALQEKVDAIPRLTAKRDVDQEQFDEWDGKVKATRAKAGTGPVIEPMTCPHCAGLLVLDAAQNLQAYEAPASKPDPKAVALLPLQEESLRKVTSFLDHDKKAIAEAESAKSALAELTANGVANVAQSDLDDIAAKLATAVTHSKTVRASLQAEKDKRNRAAKADEDTKKALGYHTDVEQWEAIAGWLAPDGIQAELMAAALDPFNTRLGHTAALTGWDRVSVDGDMTIRVGARPYSLASASARWRAEAALAEAISFISGARSFMLDEVDVLDSGNRIAFLKWMHTIAAAGEVETAIIIGTFKAPPTCPATFQVEWVANGLAGQSEEQQEAA